MNILVISNALVVLELFKQASAKKGIQAELVHSLKEAKGDSYSVIFIDDTIHRLKEEIDVIQNSFDYNELIIIGKESQNLASRTLPKPFLLEDILLLLEELEDEYGSLVQSVLDINEIEKIKKLMQETEETAHSLLDNLKEQKKLKAKNKEAKQLLKELCTLEKKELKKLFKKYKISIKIERKG